MADTSLFSMDPDEAFRQITGTQHIERYLPGRRSTDSLQYIVRATLKLNNTHTLNPALKRELPELKEKLEEYFIQLLQEGFDCNARSPQLNEDHRFVEKMLVHDGGVVFVDLYFDMGPNVRGSGDAPPFTPVDHLELNQTILCKLQNTKAHRYGALLWMPRKAHGTPFQNAAEMHQQMQDFKESAKLLTAGRRKSQRKKNKKARVDQDAQCS